MVDGRPLHFGVSCGIAVHAGTSNPDLATIDGLLSDADSAMYAAKQTGRGRIALFEPAHRYVRRDPELIAPALRTAADNDEIRMMVQPIVALGTGQVSGFETFVRWDLPEVGLLSPADFCRPPRRLARSSRSAPASFASRWPSQLAARAGGVDQRVVGGTRTARLCRFGAGRAASRGLPLSGLALEVNVPALAEPQALHPLDQLRTAGLGSPWMLRTPAGGTVDTAALSATAVKIDRTLTASRPNPDLWRGCCEGSSVWSRTWDRPGSLRALESREQAEGSS